MRKLFLLGLSTFAAMMLGAVAQAADMPVKAAPPPPPPMYNWTGFYIGGHIGGAWADRNNNDHFDGNNNCFWGSAWSGRVCFDDSNFGRNKGHFIGGGQVGFNYQIGQYVWGVEGQISAVGHDNDDEPCDNFTWNATRDHLFRCSLRSNWIATVAARVGVTFGQTGNWLLYIKGGGAFADARFRIRLRDDCSWTFCNNINFGFNNNDDTRTGWMIGAGIEYGAWGNWSWKLEYNFMDFGNDNNNFDHFIASCSCDIRHNFDNDIQVHVVKFGLNYRFAPAPMAAPVAARY